MSPEFFTLFPREKRSTLLLSLSLWIFHPNTTVQPGLKVPKTLKLQIERNVRNLPTRRCEKIAKNAWMNFPHEKREGKIKKEWWKSKWLFPELKEKKVYILISPTSHNVILLSSGKYFSFKTQTFVNVRSDDGKIEFPFFYFSGKFFLPTIFSPSCSIEFKIQRKSKNRNNVIPTNKAEVCFLINWISHFF